MNSNQKNCFRQIALLFMLSPALMLNNCANYYLPNSHQVPLLTKKHDARFSMTGTSYSTGKRTSDVFGMEFQGSYAVSDKIGVMFNTSTATSIAFTSEAYKYVDLGGGYFKANSSEHLIFETYGGVGFGNSARAYGDAYNNTNFIKYYVQPSLGYKTKFVELAISWRLASLNFTAMSNTGVIDDENQIVIQAIKNNPTSFLSEPALTVRLGIKPVKVQAQWGWSHNLSLSDYPIGYSYVNVGLFISIGVKEE